MTIKLNKLNNTIIKCKKCPRLIKFIKKISVEKRKQNINENYWGKPVGMEFRIWCLLHIMLLSLKS